MAQKAPGNAHRLDITHIRKRLVQGRNLCPKPEYIDVHLDEFINAHPFDWLISIYPKLIGILRSPLEVRLLLQPTCQPMNSCYKSLLPRFKASQFPRFDYLLPLQLSGLSIPLINTHSC